MAEAGLVCRLRGRGSGGGGGARRRGLTEGRSVDLRAAASEGGVEGVAGRGEPSGQEDLAGAGSSG
jgi:hypothetical protein